MSTDELKLSHDPKTKDRGAVPAVHHAHHVHHVQGQPVEFLDAACGDVDRDEQIDEPFPVVFQDRPEVADLIRSTMATWCSCVLIA